MNDSSSKQLRVVSMVPSVTETLLSFGVNVVGRTRFCVHPKEKVSAIPALGGTKSMRAEEFIRLAPDLLILDREENVPEMKAIADGMNPPCQVLVSHVTSLKDLLVFCEELEKVFPELPEFAKFCARTQRIIDAAPIRWDWSRIPGLKEEWGIRARTSQLPLETFAVRYLIWKDPWMAVSRQTFIGDVLAKLGAQHFADPGVLGAPDSASTEVPGAAARLRYPTLSEEEISRRDVFPLFSSEPYPFHQKTDELRSQFSQGAIIDGESYSWFGLRAIRFLEAELGLSEL